MLICSGLSNSGALVWLRFSSCSYIINNSGATNMDTATTRVTKLVCSGVKMASVVVTLNNTKANSPPCARANANSKRCFLLMLKVMARAYKIQAFTTISNATSAITVENSLANNSKLIEAPTVIKNNPRSRPLKGSISASSSCLNSLSARTTPAKNVPNAGESPILCITRAIATTKNSAKIVNISRM